MYKVVLFKSEHRFEEFRAELERQSFEVVVLDFDLNEWSQFDFNDVFAIVYFPAFSYSSNHPQALYTVKDNLHYIHARYPHLEIFPDANVIEFYSDKYRQMLFLQSCGMAHPDTYALVSPTTLDLAEQKLGYPMVVKNRFGAGGDYVFRVENRKQLEHFYRLSVMNFLGWQELLFFARRIFTRRFFYHLIRERRMEYPFLSPPLLAQRFVQHDRDLKTVVGGGSVVEAHWRIRSDPEMWKMNIDGGGIGEWSAVPQEAIDLSCALAKELDASWVNVDLIHDGTRFLVSEFSPVWHHYGYKEQSSFVYKEDYNIDVPLEESLNLEFIIVSALKKKADWAKTDKRSV